MCLIFEGNITDYVPVRTINVFDKDGVTSLFNLRNKQDAQLSQRDRTAECVSFGRK